MGRVWMLKMTVKRPSELSDIEGPMYTDQGRESVSDLALETLKISTTLLWPTERR